MVMVTDGGDVLRRVVLGQGVRESEKKSCCPEFIEYPQRPDRACSRHTYTRLYSSNPASLKKFSSPLLVLIIPLMRSSLLRLVL